MDFNLIFEILLVFTILIIVVCAVNTQKNTMRFRTKAALNYKDLSLRLLKAEQQNKLLSERVVLAENIDSSIFAHFFDIVKQLLSLQKFIFEESR